MKKGFLNLDHLYVLKTVAEYGSITKASELLSVSKSQVSRDLAELEKRLGAPLVYRTTRKIEITDAGRLLLERSAPHLEGLLDVAHELASAVEIMSGRIRITAPLDIGRIVLPDVVDEFVRLHPKVNFEVFLSQDYSDLIGRSIDLALRAGRIGKHTFKVRKLGDLGLALVASPQYVMAKNLASAEAVATEPCLSFYPVLDNQHVMSDGETSIELKFRRDIVCNDPQFILRYALQGKGMALLPDLLCQEPLEAGHLVQLLPRWKGPAAELHLVFPSQKRIPKHVKAFADFLAKRRIKGAQYLF